MYADFMADLVRFLVNSGIATAETVRGCTSTEITQLERQLSLHLPLALAECLIAMGHACGHLKNGDAFSVVAFNDAHEVALGLTSKADSPWRLPGNAIPFIHHQGYEFLFVYADTGDDPPVWLYIETDTEPKQQSLSFTAWLRESAIAAIEGKPWNDEVCREISLHRDNWIERKKKLDEYDIAASKIRHSLIARLILSDRERGRITGPTEIQEIWNLEFPKTELYGQLVSERKRIPWGWVNPMDA
ncbi:MAG: SMI1/KNR4 family protein [Pirellula sp.]|jgi:hypothetical protein|nr:SMI1/KNR4 family protein [Pirellula sp.]